MQVFSWRERRKQRYKVVSSHLEIQFWNSEHKSSPLCPRLDRGIRPVELYETEKWMVSIFEPIRQSFFAALPMDPPTMQFMMREADTQRPRW